ncbi:hypothetical protein PINS_up022864 [Pythium insidiosum]|nr:hypothetical protein PINS_up022864 [Pythium insidiosum]
MCDVVMDLILDHDVSQGSIGEFGRLIRQRRFEIHNAEYLEMIHEESIASSKARGRLGGERYAKSALGDDDEDDV